VLGLFDDKYDTFRTPKSDMPTSSQKKYRGEPVVLRLEMVDAALSWDNNRLREPAR
jgi:hypothetical protein